MTSTNTLDGLSAGGGYPQSYTSRASTRGNQGLGDKSDNATAPSLKSRQMDRWSEKVISSSACHHHHRHRHRQHRGSALHRSNHDRAAFDWDTIVDRELTQRRRALDLEAKNNALRIKESNRRIQEYNRQQAALKSANTAQERRIQDVCTLPYIKPTNPSSRKGKRREIENDKEGSIRIALDSQVREKNKMVFQDHFVSHQTEERHMRQVEDSIREKYLKKIRDRLRVREQYGPPPCRSDNALSPK